MISWKLKTRGQRPIGLDIGHNSIKMIQLAVNGGHISVLAAAKVFIEPDINDDVMARRNFVVSAVKQILADGKFHGKDVVSNLPNDKLKITSVRLAETETEGIEQALKKEAAQRFGLDPEKDIINYVVAGDVRQGDEVKNEFIVFAADSESIKSQIELLEEMGLQPVGLDTVPGALFRSFERTLRRQEDRERTMVFVDVGSRFTTVVFSRGGEISFVKQIPIGGQRFDREIASKLGVSIEEARTLRNMLRTGKTASVDSGVQGLSSSQGTTVQTGLDVSTRQVIVDAVGSVAEELAKEISLCFRYYTVTFRGKRVERAIFTGGEAYENILLNVLKRQLTVEIEVAQPLKGFDMKDVDFGNDRRSWLCEWSVAVGLSLKGWDGSDDMRDNYERN